LAELRERGASAATLVAEVNRDLSGEVRAALERESRGIEASAVTVERTADAWWRIEIRVVREDPALAQAVHGLAATAGAALRRLEWQPTSLEMVFHRVVSAGAS
ncbi:MAG: hypothetical protein JNK53_01360, partial [Phycisphaerae bacterium]|nr:hypothetical protein [Phycisphaerae bacterium]